MIVLKCGFISALEVTDLKKRRLCRDVCFPRPLHDKADHEAALAAIASLWGREHSMTVDQADWFALVADLISDYEESTEKKAKPLPLAKRLAALLEEHDMTVADLGRLLDLEPSMGGKVDARYAPVHGVAYPHTVRPFRAACGILPVMPPLTIVPRAQTGVDRAALDAALATGARECPIFLRKEFSL